MPYLYVMSAILRFFFKKEKKKSVQSLIYTVSRNDEKRKQKKKKNTLRFRFQVSNQSEEYFTVYLLACLRFEPISDSLPSP